MLFRSNDPETENISASPIHRLAEIEHKDLSLPMTLTDGWVWEDEEDEEQLSDESFERKLGNQGVELMDEGCGMTYELITAGPCAGEVWSFSDVGVSPCLWVRISWCRDSSLAKSMRYVCFSPLSRSPSRYTTQRAQKRMTTDRKSVV